MIVKGFGIHKVGKKSKIITIRPGDSAHHCFKTFSEPFSERGCGGYKRLLATPSPDMSQFISS